MTIVHFVMSVAEVIAYSDFPGLGMLTDRHLAVAAVAIGLVTLVGLFRSRRSLAGTTLLSSWRWSVWAVGTLTVCELTAAAAGSPGGRPPTWLAPLRFVALTSTFCPMMALWGARRPQNREWKYIVGCLWLVLALPAAWGFLWQAGRFRLEGIWAFFLLGLIGLGACNHLLTRYWPSSLAYAAAQLVLVAPYLPGPGGSLPSGQGAGTGLLALMGQLGLAAALALAHGVAARHRRPPPHDPNPLNRLWFAFRDTFGAVWALRVAQRTNAAATMYNWKIELRWDGFYITHPPAGPSPLENGDLPAETARAVERHLRSLLRRFVSTDWINEQLAQR